MKTILITGAGSGMGRDSAITLVRRGHTVIATTHTAEQAEKLEVYAKEQKCILEIFKLDITKAEDRQKIKNRNIDVLLNAAGVGESGPLSEIPFERVRSNFETNVFGTLELSQIALQEMIARGNGTVLIISSVLGRIPSAFLSTYSMTKYALAGAGAAMRSEVHRVAPDVHVTLIEPGAYATGFNQRIQAKKYEWMDNGQYAELVPQLHIEDKRLKWVEMQTTRSIVNQIVKAAEAKKPWLRYGAPWYQKVGVQLLRMIGI